MACSFNKTVARIHNFDQQEETVAQEIQRSQIVRFVVAFVIVAGLVFAFEILPLHFGSKAIPWNELMPYVNEKFPRMLIIALIVAAYLGFGPRSGSGD